MIYEEETDKFVLLFLRSSKRYEYNACEVEEYIKGNNITKPIIIDLLLSNGSTWNRFMIVKLDAFGGIFYDIYYGKNIGKSEKNVIIKFYIDNCEVLNGNDVLTRSEKILVAHGRLDIFKFIPL